MSQFQIISKSASRHSFKEFFQGIGTIIGFPYAVHAVIYLNAENITSIPYAGVILAKYLPLVFYQWIVPILLIGTFANYYSNFGIALDIVIQKIPYFIYTNENLKLNPSISYEKNIGHVIGALIGIVIAIYFIYCNSKNPDASFSLPFGAAKRVPNSLLQVSSVLYISGACSNLFSHFAEGAKIAFNSAKYLNEIIQLRIKNIYYPALSEKCNGDKFINKPSNQKMEF